MNLLEKLSTNELCVCCKEKDKESYKKAIFPKWIQCSSKADKSADLAWVCGDCSEQIKKRLDDPASKIFQKIENKEGFNDFEADLLIRWMWKNATMFALSEDSEKILGHGLVPITHKCFKSITDQRDEFSIAISLIEDGNAVANNTSVTVNPYYSDTLTAGVFDKISIITYKSRFERLVPDDFTKYTLSSSPHVLNPKNKIKATTGFYNHIEATNINRKTANINLLGVHEFGPRKHVIEMSQINNHYNKNMADILELVKEEMNSFSEIIDNLNI